MIERARAVLNRLSGPTADERMQKRIAAMGTNPLADWCETAAAGLGASISAWQREGRAEDMLEAQNINAQLVLALDELSRRTA